MLQFIANAQPYTQISKGASLTVHSVCHHTQRQRNGFSSIATRGFAYANTGIAAYTFCVHVCEHWSIKR
jgi:hypothetical protein